MSENNNYEDRRAKSRLSDKRDRQELGYSGRRWIWWGVGIVLMLLLGGWVIRIAAFPVNQATRVAERTFNADNMIRQYEWFKQQNQDIIAIDAQLAARRAAVADFETSAGPRADWRFDDRQEWGRLTSVVRGLEGQRTQMVAEYNARAEMMNRDIFRTRDLPERIDQLETNQ